MSKRSISNNLCKMLFNVKLKKIEQVKDDIYKVVSMNNKILYVLFDGSIAITYSERLSDLDE